MGAITFRGTGQKSPHQKRQRAFLTLMYIQLLIGRDLPEAHRAHQQLIVPNESFAQRISLRWIMIVEVYLRDRHPTTERIVNKTRVSTYTSWLKNYI